MVNVINSKPNIVIDGQAFIEQTLGTEQDDQINGTDGFDRILGNGGNDQIFGNGSNDFIDGGFGNDTIRGGTGDDVVGGGSGRDIVYGDAGRDFVTGNAVNDLGSFDDGADDLLYGGAGRDTFGFSVVKNNPGTPLGVDTIKDFRLNDFDRISITIDDRNGRSVGIVANDALAAARSEHIIYSQSTGHVFHNQNGSAAGFGTGGLFINVETAAGGVPNLTAASFDLNFPLNG
jgi:Ca2+-binding RTX toxin-like protein